MTTPVSDQRPCSTCLTRKWQLRIRNARPLFFFIALVAVVSSQIQAASAGARAEPRHRTLNKRTLLSCWSARHKPSPPHSMLAPHSPPVCPGPEREVPGSLESSPFRPQNRDSQYVGRGQSLHWWFGFWPLSHHWSEPCDSQGAAFQISKHGFCPLGRSLVLFLCAKTVSKKQVNFFFIQVVAEA